MRVAVSLAALILLGGCSSEGDFSERTHNDVWFQAPNNDVDILWVVDNSSSMGDEQATLAFGFSSFVGQLEQSGTDFHMGVISTSFDYANPDRATLIGDPPFLTEDDDYLNEFVARAQLGIDGEDKEKGLEAAAWALSPAMTTSGPNAGFLRASAQLLIVFVSDEEDCSDEGALEGLPAEECYRQQEKLIPPSEYVQAFRSLKEENDRVQVGAIVGVENARCDDAYPGSRYIYAAAKTGGFVGDICQNDWSEMLSTLGLTATGIRSAFQTTYKAKTETIEVIVNGDVVEANELTGWTYDENTWFLTFAESVVPARDAEISMSYTIAAGGGSAPEGSTAE